LYYHEQRFDEFDFWWNEDKRLEKLLKEAGQLRVVIKLNKISGNERPQKMWIDSIQQIYENLKKSTYISRLMILLLIMIEHGSMDERP